MEKNMMLSDNYSGALPHTLIVSSSWTTRPIAISCGQQTMPTHLGFDKPSLTIESLAARRLEDWRSPLIVLFHPCSCPLSLSGSGQDAL